MQEHLEQALRALSQYLPALEHSNLAALFEFFVLVGCRTGLILVSIAASSPLPLLSVARDHGSSHSRHAA